MLETDQKHDTCKECDGSTNLVTKDKTMNDKTIDTLFTYHAALDLDVKQFEELRTGAKVLGKLMIKYGKRQDDTSLAIQKLRESLHFAIASIVVPEDKQPNG